MISAPATMFMTPSRADHAAPSHRRARGAGYAIGGAEPITLPEERVGPAVLRVTILEPFVEFAVVPVALFAAVARGVVAQVQDAPPAVGPVRSRAVGCIRAEDRDVAGSQIEEHSGGSIDGIVGKLVIHQIGRAHV